MKNPLFRLSILPPAACLALCILLIITAGCLTTGCRHYPSLDFKQTVAAKLSHDLRNKVVTGMHGWLFLQPEVEYAVAPLPLDNIQTIAVFSRELALHGITLYVAPLPNKIDIYPEMLTEARAPHPVNGLRDNLLSGLKAAGVRVIDVLPAFDSAKAHCRLFDSLESHWTSAGIETAARVIARGIDSGLAARGISREARYIVCDTVFNGCADLPELMRGDGKELWYPTQVRQVHCADGSPFSDDKKSGILILGDSFVNHAHWWSAHLGAQIARFIGHSTRTYSSIQANTEGPSFYKRMPKLFPDSGVVIWAFSSRVLQYRMSADIVK